MRWDGDNAEDEEEKIKSRKLGSRKCDTAQYVEKPVRRIERRMLRTRDGLRGSSSSLSSLPFPRPGVAIRIEDDGNINEGRWGAPEMGPGWRRSL
jgi:hypothetical protein